MTEYLVSYLPDGERDRYPRTLRLSWDQLRGVLGDSRACECDASTCGAGDNLRLVTRRDGSTRAAGCRHKYGPAWSAAAYPRGAVRAKANVASCQLLVLDFDHGGPDLLATLDQKLAGVRWVAHGSHSDGLRGERAIRVVVPLDAPVLGGDWDRFWESAVERLGVADLVDRQARDASRLFFLPSHRRDWRPLRASNEGSPVDAAATLAAAPPRALRAPSAAPAGDLPPASPRVLARARARLAAAGPAVEGRGGDAHTFSACAALVRGLGLTDAEAWPLLLEWNATCSPPWDEDDLAEKVANARAYGQGDVGADRREVWEADDVDAALGIDPSAPPPPAYAPKVEPAYPSAVALDVLDEIAAGRAPRAAEVAVTGEEGSWERDFSEARRDLSRVLAGGAGANSPGEDSPLFQCAAEVFRGADEPVRWLVRGLVVEGGIAVVATEPKSAKTWVLTELAVGVSTGTPAFAAHGAPDTGHPCSPGTVCYFYAEDLRGSIRNRLRALCAGRGLDPRSALDRLHVQPRGRELDVTRDEDLARLIASCRRVARVSGPVKLLCLDPLRDVHTGKENEADDMARVMRRLRVLGGMLGCTIAIVHHASKGSKETAGRRPGQKMRGSGAVHGAIDSGIYLEDLAVDGDRTVFRNTVHSEVKAARSAGTFELELRIRDDANGEAELATWRVSRGGKVEGSAQGDARAAEDEAVTLCHHMALAESRQAPPMRVDEIRKAMGVGKGGVQAAIAAAAGRGWISRGQRDRWVLTDAGREVAREDAPGGDA